MLRVARSRRGTSPRRSLPESPVVVRLLLASFALLAPLAVAPAHATDAVALADDEDDDLFGDDTKSTGKNADVPDASAFNDDGDDFQIAAPVKIEPPKVVEVPKGPPSRLPLDLNGKAVLADNWAPSIVAYDVDSVLVEVPVLYAVNGTGFDGTAYWLVAEVFADGKKLAESRTQVSKESVSTKGPSAQFFRLFAPVGAASGVLEVRVSKIVGTAKPGLLFVRTLNYALPG